MTFTYDPASRAPGLNAMSGMAIIRYGSGIEVEPDVFAYGAMRFAY